MTVSDYQQRIQQTIQNLEQQAPQIAQQMGLTGLTLLEERSIRDGITVDGAYAEYSQKPVYKSSFKSKARNAAGSAYASSGGKGTYGELRQVQGLKSDHVNMQYRGRTWTALRPISQEQTGHVYSTLTGCSDSEAQQILLANLKRYGNFLRLRREEVTQIQDDAGADVTNILRRNL